MAKCRAEALSDPDQHFDYPIGMLRTEQGAVQRQDPMVHLAHHEAERVKNFIHHDYYFVYLMG